MKIACISSWPPRRCGIASFAFDLRRGLTQDGLTQMPVIALSRETGEFDYDKEVVGVIVQDDPDSYRRAARTLNNMGLDAVILQHEYGLYGGPDGDMVLGLVADLKVPVISVLHTVLSKPSAGQYKVLGRLAEVSERVVIIAERARSILHQVYALPPQKIVHIPHGVPEIPSPKAVRRTRRELGAEGKMILMSFGLLGPGKGLELAIRSVGEVKVSYPNFVYLVVGATHPNERLRHGEAYREGLQKTIEMMGLSEQVRLIDKFLDEDELMAHLAACDIYITPYPGREQISSGTLSFAVGLGKPIVSTPFVYAEEILADGAGVLVPFNDPGKLGGAILNLLTDSSYRAQIAAKASARGRSMQWSKVALSYAKLAKSVRRIHPVGKPKVIPAIGQDTISKFDFTKLPAISLDHVVRLTDDTGMIQHALGSIPNRRLGYTTDDNARALLAMAVAPKELSPQAIKLAENYLAFLYYAWGAEGWFHNCFNYDRSPLPEKRSDDCQGRALWGLAATIRVWSELPMAKVAFRMFQESLPTWGEMTSIRGLALVIMALATLLRSTPTLGTADSSEDLSDQLVNEYTGILIAAADKIVAEYMCVANSSWLWFENILSYNCGLLPAAMFQAYGVVPRKEYLKVAAESLHFLVGKTVENGILRPVGNRGWFHRGGEKAYYDQQPLEAWAMTLAGVSAYDVTHNQRWLTVAETAERWFLGQNDVGLSMFDARTGGCSDGLHPEGISENQGAESTLAYVLTRALQHGVRERMMMEVQEA